MNEATQLVALPSTAETEIGPVIFSEGGSVQVSYDYESNVRWRWKTVTFKGALDFRFTSDGSCQHYMVSAYSNISEILRSSWLEETRRESVYELPDGMRHFAVYFDHAGCFEVIARNFDVTDGRHHGSIRSFEIPNVVSDEQPSQLILNRSNVSPYADQHILPLYPPSIEDNDDFWSATWRLKFTKSPTTQETLDAAAKIVRAENSTVNIGFLAIGDQRAQMTIISNMHPLEAESWPTIEAVLISVDHALNGIASINDAPRDWWRGFRP